ncbi:MAG TPA: undecaprenyldiphospho-muramoylpentapeptide beta-N-acetylglucosaminyltransferase [Blastocatellia bacterium]|nr:undecaprenyldiphospho-muramoylpentapeptide beta-N-acetylglucosaminyltransferase [Blastocatellia bacterium]
MRVIIAAGGTGGHIFPGVAIARELLRRDPAAEILFVGTSHGLESKIVPREGFKLELIKVSALKGVSASQRLKSLAGLPLSFVAARRILKRFRPDVVIGVGGYSSGPTLLMAALLRIPTMVVEPNAMPGFTNRVLARWVDAAALTFEDALKYFGERGRVTGNPIRNDFALLKKKERGERLSVLIFGGSQGAHAINTAMVEALKLLAPHRDRLDITHQTGERDFEMVKRGYAEAGFDTADVRPFIEDMAKRFESADLLVCRSGATTAAEVAAAGKAAIFVPFPFATDDHQRKNAEAFVRAGAGRMILQQELTPERLAGEIERLIGEPDEIDLMEEASRLLGRPDSAKQAVDLAMEIVGRR